MKLKRKNNKIYKNFQIKVAKKISFRKIYQITQLIKKLKSFALLNLKKTFNRTKGLKWKFKNLNVLNKKMLMK